MPFLYSTRPPPYPILIFTNQTHVDNDDDEEEEDDESFLSSSTMILSSMTSLSNFVHPNEQNQYRIRMHVDDFHPNELNISIRNGRLIVRGKHVVRAPILSSSQLLTTNSTVNNHDDNEPDFIAKEFKRTFLVPSNVDVRKAHAQFYPEQQLLIIEIPFQHSPKRSIRAFDIFLTIVTLLLMDRALRITYEQFMINEQQHRNSSSQQ